MPISEDVQLGAGVKIWHPDLVNLYGCQIGAGATIGPFVEIQKGVVVGANCIISSHSLLCEGVTLADDVFIGHNVTFCNEKHPRAGRSDWTLPPENAIHVGTGVSIGSGAVILPGVTIGAYAEVGAGAIITKDVLANAVVIMRVEMVVLEKKSC